MEKQTNQLLARFKKSKSTTKHVDNLLTVEEVANKYFKSVTKVHLETYVGMMRPNEVQDFKNLFSCVCEGRNLSGNIYAGIDKGNRPYVYPKFNSAKGEIGCKIVPIGKIQLMISDYRDGRVNIAFKAEELIEYLLNR